MYNTRAVRLDQAKKIAIAYLKSGIIPLFVSPPGTGKTSIVAEIAKEMKAELRRLRLNSLPPEEAIGLQFIDHDAKRTVRYAPSWVPAADGSDGPVLVFLDELMQAPDEYRKGIMSALLERHIGEHQIPDNCMFIAAGNSVEDGSNVYELDRATADRFGVILIRPDFELWANNYAGDHNIHPAIMGYLRMRPEHFELTDCEAADEADQVIRPSPRSWEAVSKYIYVAEALCLDDDEVKTGIMGKVGQEIGSSLWTLMGALRDLPPLQKLLDMSPREQKKNTPKSMDVMWAYGQAMIWHANCASKTLKILELFDAFDLTSNVPIAECRAHVVETILSRARKVHDFSVSEEPAIADYLKKWDGQNQAEAANDEQQIRIAA